jgi:tetratricopeptide (TPR) repeat protein
MSLLRSLGVFAALMLLCGGLVLSVPAAASAQSEADLEQAKQLFLEGSALAEKGDWAPALRAFERSYQLAPRESSLLNYAVSLKELHRYVEAREALTRLLRDHEFAGDKEILRVRATGLLEEVEGKVGVLDLRGLDEDTRHQIEVDGRAVEDDGRRPLKLDQDPRDLVTLRVALPDDDGEFRWQGPVREGEQIPIDVTFPESAGGSSIFESPWFWVATGVVVAAGAAVGLYFILDAGADLEPRGDKVVSLDI